MLGFRFKVLINFKNAVPVIHHNSHFHFITFNKIIPQLLSVDSNYLNRLSISTNSVLNAGHAKWQNIKVIKASKDKERGDAFQRFRKLILLASKENGGINPDLNSKLARVLEEATTAKMPLTSIDKILKSGESELKDAKPYSIGVVGAGGSYIVVDFVTSKHIRTKQTIVGIVKRLGMSEIRTNTPLYEEKGILIAAGTEDSLSEALDHAIECSAEDVTYEDGYLTFLCSPNDFMKVKRDLEKKKYVFEYADIDKMPNIYSHIRESDTTTFKKVIAKIEAMDEVSRIQINFEL